MGRTNKRDRRVRIVGVQRKEPDVRRLAKVIIRMSLGDGEAATDRLNDLAQQEREIARRRKGGRTDESPEQATS